MAKVLKKGSKGADVKKVQTALNKKSKPSPKLDPDGMFGAKTETAVKTFQGKNDLKKDGIVGVKTLGALSGSGGGAAPAKEKSPAPTGKGNVSGPLSGVNKILVDALKAVADHYGVTIVVTSGKRTPDDQARVMWDYWKVNLKEGEIYVVLRSNKKLLATLQKAYNEKDKKTFTTEIKKVAGKLSRHVAGNAVDVKKNTDKRAVGAMASMFHHVVENTCHHFDTKTAPSSINDSVKAKWPKV